MKNLVETAKMVKQEAIALARTSKKYRGRRQQGLRDYCLFLDLLNDKYYNIFKNNPYKCESGAFEGCVVERYNDEFDAIILSHNNSVYNFYKSI